MKVALLQITAFLTDPKLIFRVLEKGFDIVIYKEPLDGGGVQVAVNVILKKNCLADFDKKLSSLVGKNQETKEYVSFFGITQGDDLLDRVRGVFSDSRVTVVELDISNAETIKDIDKIISQANC
jgi:hypothetical protein